MLDSATNMVLDEGFVTLVTGELTRVGVGAARIAPVVLFSPAFGGRLMPSPIRIFVSLLLSFTLLPRDADIAGAINELGGIVVLLVKEFVIGFSVSLLITMSFEAASAAGVISELVRGSSMQTLLAPTSQDSALPLGVFYQFSALSLFLACGFHRAIICALASGYESIPLTGLPPAALFSGQGVLFLLHACGEMLRLAVTLAAPVMAFSFLLDAIGGIVNRMTGSINVYFIGLTAKAWCGIIVSLAAFGVVMGQVHVIFDDLIETITAVFV